MKGFHKIDFIFCTFNILTTAKLYEMRGFNKITTSDYCELFIDISRDILLDDKLLFIPSSFERQLKSNSPKSVKQHNK